jgi:DNA-binding XRE family transcriptional regulator
MIPMPVDNEMEGLKILGQKIRTHRQLLGYRQAELAELCGISDRTLRDIEAGSGKAKMETWYRLAQVLGMDMVLQQKPMSYPSGAPTSAT